MMMMMTCCVCMCAVDLHRKITYFRLFLEQLGHRVCEFQKAFSHTELQRNSNKTPVVFAGRRRIRLRSSARTTVLRIQRQITRRLTPVSNRCRLTLIRSKAGKKS